MPEIHPSAIIDPGVELADDVYIGPGCVIRSRVKLGPGCILHGNVYLHGPLTMGQRNRVYPFTCIGFAPQDLKWDPAVEGAGIVIGEHNTFRESFTAHRATGEKPTRIGSHNFCMANSHIGHDAIVGDRCTLAQGAMIGGHCLIGDNVILGGNAGTHQFCRVGRLSMVAGTIGVTQDVPPFCTVFHNRCVGALNLVGLRRAGLRDRIKPLGRALELCYKSGLSNRSAVEAIAKELADDALCMEFAEFIRGTKRGLTAYREDATAT